MSVTASFREQELELPTAQLKMRRYEHDLVGETIVPEGGGRHILGMHLSPRSELCAAYAVGSMDFEPLGRLTLYPSDVPVRFGASVDRLWGLQCSFDAQIFDPRAIGWNKDRLREALHVRSRSVRFAFDRIAAEMCEPGFASALLIESLCALMAVDLTRHFNGLSASPGGGLPAWRVRRIEERVRAECAPPTLSELAAICGMSPRHLTRAFRQQTGRTLSELVTEVRTLRAKALLAADEFSLKQIGESLGFAQLSNFSTAFLRATGERPSAFRARMHSERYSAGRSASGRASNGRLAQDAAD